MQHERLSGKKIGPENENQGLIAMLASGHDSYEPAQLHNTTHLKIFRFWLKDVCVAEQIQFR